MSEVVLIPLTKGKYAKIDSQDFELVGKYKWYCSNGYAATKRGEDGKTKYILMHRLIMGEPVKMQIDHINADRSDNRRCNLRIVTSSENSRRQLPQSNTASSYKGISWYGSDRVWVARIFVDGENIYLGRSIDEKTAARIYDYAAVMYYGEFARVNFENEPLLTEKEYAELTKRRIPSSRFRGVGWDKSKRKWVAYISVKGKYTHLGRYSSEIEAAKAYNEAAKQYHKDKAILNSI